MILRLPSSCNLEGCADARCPACGQVGRFSPFSSYDRHVVWYSRVEGKAVEVTATIERVRCECGVTHALIPTTLVPYRPWSLMLCLVVTILMREARLGPAEALRRFQASITACRSIASDAGRLARAINAAIGELRTALGDWERDAGASFGAAFVHAFGTAPFSQVALGNPTRPARRARASPHRVDAGPAAGTP